jgi:hypothetical protein
VDLLNKVEEVAPALHVFGHVHEGYGVSSNGTTTFVNASSCTLRYRAINPPLVFDLYMDEEGAVTEVVSSVSKVKDWGRDKVSNWLSQLAEVHDKATSKHSDAQEEELKEGEGGAKHASLAPMMPIGAIKLLLEKNLTGAELCALDFEGVTGLLGGLEEMRPIIARCNALFEIQRLVAQYH